MNHSLTNLQVVFLTSPSSGLKHKKASLIDDGKNIEQGALNKLHP